MTKTQFPRFDSCKKIPSRPPIYCRLAVKKFFMERFPYKKKTARKLNLQIRHYHFCLLPSPYNFRLVKRCHNLSWIGIWCLLKNQFAPIYTQSSKGHGKLIHLLISKLYFLRCFFSYITYPYSLCNVSSFDITFSGMYRTKGDKIDSTFKCKILPLVAVEYCSSFIEMY